MGMQLSKYKKSVGTLHSQVSGLLPKRSNPQGSSLRRYASGLCVVWVGGGRGRVGGGGVCVWRVRLLGWEAQDPRLNGSIIEP